MNKKKIFAIVCASLLGLGACKKDRVTDPLDNGNIEESQLKGTISGVVLDSTAHGIAGVSVVTVPAGYATTTDSTGSYTIPSVKGGTYTIQFTKSFWRDTSVSGIAIAVDQDKKSVNMVMHRGSDAYIDTVVKKIADSLSWDRDIEGSISNSSKVAKVELIAEDAQGQGSTLPAASWNAAESKYSGKLRVPKAGGTLRVLAYDAAGHFIAYGVGKFDALSNQIAGPSFDGQNAMPTAKAGDDFVVLHGASVNLDGSKSTDELGKTVGVVKWEWNIGSGFVNAPAGKLAVTMPNTGDQALAILRVTDGDGNVDLDTSIAFFGDVSMVSITGGSFVMGSDVGIAASMPSHNETVGNFEIGKTEITNAQLAYAINRLVGDQSLKIARKDTGTPTMSYFYNGKELLALENFKIINGLLIPEAEFAHMPVEGISWYGSVVYANSLSESQGLAVAYDLKSWTYNPGTKGYRLPTEPEWEYAAKANQSYKYAGSDNVNDVGWTSLTFAVDEFGWESPAEVALKMPNAFGLYDMTGNVTEWTEGSWANPYVTGTPEPRFRAIKGGGIGVDYKPSVDADGYVSSARFKIDIENGKLGFRIARTK